MGKIENRFAFGPQHPASHGVLSCVLYLSNEFILYIDVQIGFLHRGTEKLLEYKNCHQGMPYFDRLDYVSVVHNEHVFVFAYEMLCVCTISYRVSLLRVLLLEITRVFNGLLANSCAVFDLGSLSPLLWAFEEREKIMTIFDWLSGVRMHVSYVCIGGVLDDLCVTMLDYICTVIASTLSLADLLDVTILSSRILYLRLRGLSMLDINDISLFSISGTLIRSTGVLWDIRLVSTYELYSVFNFDVCVTCTGDCYDRLLIRIYDMKTSCILIRDVLPFLSTVNLGEVYCIDINIENLIYLFGGLMSTLSYGISFCSVEASKGEYCVTLSIYHAWSRVRIRCADYIHVLMLDSLCKGLMICDLVALIGNLDIVFGSVDR